MENHIKILGIIHMVLGVLGICVALLVLAIFGLGALGIAGAAAHEQPEAFIAVPIVAAIGTFLVVLVAVLSLPGIIAGYELLNYRPWARILTIVLCAINLLNIPVGTAIGIYGLWVLLNQETERLFLSPPVSGPLTSP